MWLTRIAIDRRVSITMAILAVIVLGIVGLSRMPWAIRPDVDIPVITVTVPYPGAGPEEIEQRILQPLEDQVSVINGVDEVESVGYENIGTVTVSFDYEVDIDVAAADVRDALSRAQASFPDDAQQPTLFKIDINAMPVMVFGITGDRDPRDLRELVEDKIEPRLGQISGVASVTVAGGAQREIQILAEKDRLEAFGISISELAQMIRAESIDVPAGSIEEGKREYALRVLGEFKSMQEIRDLRLTTRDDEILRLDTIATVLDTIAEPDRYARIDGNPSIRVAITKQADANTVQVARDARAELSELVGDIDTAQGTGELPSDIRVIVARDDSREVILSILDVRNSLIYGALLAGLVVFFALNNFRGTLIVCLAIPTSLLCGFLPIGIGFQFTLNTMVMLGLALVVGTLVDDSIVVLENIDRHRERGEAPDAAAFNGRTEISGAAFGTTAVDTVVFVPVALMGGIVGQFFYPFGMTVVSCSVFSLLMAFTLTPMLASWWYERIDESTRRRTGLVHRLIVAIEGAFDAMRRAHRAILVPAVRHPYATLIVGYVLMGIVVRFVTLPFEFFPETDQGQVSIAVETAVGTRLETTDQIVREIEQRLSDRQKYPSIEHVSSVVGSESGGVFGASGSGGRYANVSVSMSPLNERRSKGMRSDQELAQVLRRDLSDLPNVKLEVTTTSAMGGGGADDIQLNILSEDRDLLFSYATDLMHKVDKIEGLRYVELSAEPGRPELHADVDRLRAADLGFSVAQIGNAVRTAFEGDTSAKYRKGGEEYDIRVELAEFNRQSISDVANLFIGVHNGQAVRLRDVADVYMSTGPSSVERYNRQRKLTLSAALDPEVLRSGTAQTKIDQIIRENPVPGVTTAWTGSVRMQQESFGRMGQALALSVILVYIVMAILYNSVLEPLNIMLTLPMAIIGGLIALKLSGHAISVVAMVGFIMLMGLVGKNAIYVVDYVDVLRGRGVERTEALLEAAPTRLRPVIMTTVTTVLAMLPTALSRNEGAEWRAPMAWTVIGGMLFSTVLSLVVVPATYAIWDQVGIFFTRLGRGMVRLIGIGVRREEDSGDIGPLGPPPTTVGPDQDMPVPPADGAQPDVPDRPRDVQSPHAGPASRMPAPRRTIGPRQHDQPPYQMPDLTRLHRRQGARKPGDDNFR